MHDWPCDAYFDKAMKKKDNTRTIYGLNSEYGDCHRVPVIQQIFDMIPNINVSCIVMTCVSDKASFI